MAGITAEAAAGVTEIEVGSFVPAKLLPQLADTAEITAYARSIPGLTVAALVPNAKGAAAAIAAGAHKITLPLSVSETHSLANLRRNHAQVLDEARQIGAMIAASFGLRASNNSATRGRPPVMSRVLAASRVTRARTSPA